MTTWSVLADLDRDNTFAATDCELCSFVSQITWRNGMTTAYQEVAAPTRATITLNNQGGEFSPDYAGSELITNGDFDDWTGDDPDNWTVTGESGSDPEVSEVGNGETHGGTGNDACNLYSSDTDTVSISQDILTSGTTYRCSFTLDETAGGKVVVKTGTTQVSPIAYSRQGFKEFDFVADDSVFKIETSGATDITIDDVSVKEASTYGKRLKRGVLVKVMCNYSSTDYTLYVGRVSNMDYQIGSSSRQTVTVELQDAMYELLDVEFLPTLETDTTTDQAIMQVFNKATIPYPYPHTYALLGVEGYCELGSCNLYDPDEVSFDTGKTTLDYVGDTSDEGKGVSALSFIKDMVRAEGGGRFWYDTRSETYTFINRHTDPLNNTVVATFDEDDFEDVKYLHGQDIMNHCEVKYRPRVLGAAGSVLWSNENTFLLKRSGSKRMTARYRDSDNENAKVAGTDFIIPKAGTDYIANSQEDNSGHIRTSYITLSVEFGASRAKIIISNSRESRDFYITTLQLRGTPLTAYDEEIVEAIDGESIAANSKYSKTIDMRAVGDSDLAYQYANYMVAKFKSPLSRIDRATFTAGVANDTMMTQAMTRTMGDRITITEADSGHDADYFIVGEDMTLSVGEEQPLRVSWILKPAFREFFGLVGVTGRSELNSNAILLY